MSPAEKIPSGDSRLMRKSDRQRAADEEHQRDRDEIQDRDALVVGREQPAFPAVLDVQVVDFLAAASGVPCASVAM